VLGRLVYRIARRRFGEVPEPFAVALHHRKLFLAATVAELAYEKASSVPPARLPELAVYRVAAVVGCSWCVDFGTMLQRLDGLDVERLHRRLRDAPRSPGKQTTSSSLTSTRLPAGGEGGAHGVRAGPLVRNIRSMRAGTRRPGIAKSPQYAHVPVATASTTG
jgi:AhpD family alkylhydroperoxidase